MRLRQRHFNPRGFGANLVLDARFIDQSDNTAVTSWVDRSGNSNNADQSTAANQPTFQTNEINGNPVVEFDGLAAPNGDILNITSPIELTNFEAIGVVNRATNAQTVLLGSDVNAATKTYVGVYTNIGSIIQFENGTQTNLISENTSGNSIYGFNNSSFFRNLSKTNWSTAYPNTNARFARVGGRIGSAFERLAGKLGSLSVLPSISDSARKRITHAAALSFKIACN